MLGRATVAAVIGSLVLASGAAAQEKPTWDDAAASVDFPVYEPTRTLGLKGRVFLGYDACATGGRGDAVRASYSRRGRSARFGIIQSKPGVCGDPGESLVYRRPRVLGRRVPLRASCEHFTPCTIDRSKKHHAWLLGLRLRDGGRVTPVQLFGSGMTAKQFLRVARSLRRVDLSKPELELNRFLSSDRSVWCVVHAGERWCGSRTPQHGGRLAPDGTVVLCGVAQPDEPLCFQNWDDEAFALSPGQRAVSGGISCVDEAGAVVCTVASGAGMRVSAAGSSVIAPPTALIAAADPGTITTFAGNGRLTRPRDGRNPTALSLQPTDVDTDAEGNVYIADAGRRIRMVDPDGVMTSIAGCAPRCERRTALKRSGPAHLLHVGPTDLTVAGDGTVYAVDSTQILRVRDGRATRIAGGRRLGFADGRGRRARFRGAEGIAIAPDGDLIVADRLNHRIRRVTPRGRVTTIAGTGRMGFSGDGGRATAARFNQPNDVAVDATGAIFVSDSLNHRVRRIAPDGIITTVAGNGEGDPRPRSFDGRPVTDDIAPFVASVDVDAAGNLYVAGSTRVIVIDPAGVVRTVANRAGREGFSGDGGPATIARLRAIAGLHVDGDGNVYVAEYRRVRRIEGPGG